MDFNSQEKREIERERDEAERDTTEMKGATIEGKRQRYRELNWNFVYFCADERTALAPLPKWR